jgi:hypothetical protein
MDEIEYVDPANRPAFAADTFVREAPDDDEDEEEDEDKDDEDDENNDEEGDGYSE